MELSEEVIAEEVIKIEEYQEWPNWPILPVKNVLLEDDEGNNRLGLMYALRGILYCIFELKLTDLEQKKSPKAQEFKQAIQYALMENYEASPIKIYHYNNTRELVEAGWLGD